MGNFTEVVAVYGDGEMGLSSRANKTRVAIAAWPWGAYLGAESIEKGARLKTSSFVRFHHNSMMPLAKVSGHYVNSIMAGYEARRGGYDEALLLDTEGFVAEGSGENIFVDSRRHRAHTPADQRAGRHHARFGNEDSQG